MSDSFLTYLFIAVIGYLLYRKFLAKKPGADAPAAPAGQARPGGHAPAHEAGEILHSAREMVVAELTKLINAAHQDGDPRLEIDHAESHLLFEMADKEFALSAEQKTQFVAGLKDLVTEAVSRAGLAGKVRVEEQVSSTLLTFAA